MIPPSRVGLLLALFVASTKALLSYNESVLAGLPILHHRYRNCHELHMTGATNADGIYVIYPYDCCPQRPVKVWCDMTTDGGGWTLIQRRGDYEHQENFFRSWSEYALGFGNVALDHWLGLDHIHALTAQSLNQIRFHLADFEGNSSWAKYDFFYVNGKADSYKLEVDAYSGTAGDAFSGHSGALFTAKDKDLDKAEGSCAISYKGAWWYTACHSSNLNGLYHRGHHESYADGINWDTLRGQHYSMKSVYMMIKPRY